MTWNENYRRLNNDETVQEGDEVLTDSALGWRAAVHSLGTPAPDPMYGAHRLYRRKKAQR